ncbi:uncharacterized protein [Diadema setosum]
MGWKMLSITLLAAILLATLQHVTGTFPFLCGEALVNAVATVCGERGYYVGPTKRSVDAFQPETRAKSFLRSVSSAEGGREKRRVRSSMIVRECCENRCSYSIVESYCNPWPETVSHTAVEHGRHGKSAEDENRMEASTLRNRPQDGASLTDVAEEPDVVRNRTSENRVENRVEKVETVLSERVKPTSSARSSSGRKSRKLSKSERRNSSRALKAARREERRRNRQRSSGEKSRKSRRKNRESEMSRRAKRTSLTPWIDRFVDKTSYLPDAEYIGRSEFEREQGIAPRASKEHTTQTSTEFIAKLRHAFSKENEESAKNTTHNDDPAGEKHGNLVPDFFQTWTSLRTFFSSLSEGR